MEQKLTQEQIDERVAILKKFRELLEKQRQKFRDYLKVLEQQELKIEAEDAEAIKAHEVMGTEIVESIASLQKVIVPMQQLYVDKNAALASPEEAAPVSQIQDELTKLQEQVLAQNEHNRELLTEHMADVRRQMLSMRNPYRARQSVYAERGAVSSLINIEA